MKASLGLKQTGVELVSPFSKTISIVRGQYYKLSVILLDSGDRPVTLTGMVLKLRLKNADGTDLLKTAIAVDNVKGEAEFELLAEETEVLLAGSKISTEVEYTITATPGVTGYIDSDLISVVERKYLFS